MIFENESVFGENPKIKYLFYPGTINKLLIVFGGYGGGYNYTRFLGDIKCHKLFLLDDHGFSNAGCWYLGENNTFEVEKMVGLLLETKREELNIPKEDVILCGVSMGGFASIYFGLKNNYNHMIASAPQLYLYTYLKNLSKKELLPSIVGDSSGEHLDHLFDSLAPTKNQHIYFFCGYGDYHLRYDILPFINNYNLDVCNISLHVFPGSHEIGAKLGPVLNDTVKSILNELEPYPFLTSLQKNELISPDYIISNETSINTTFTITPEETLFITIYPENLSLRFSSNIYLQSSLISAFPAQNNTQFKFPIPSGINVFDLTFEVTVIDTKGNTVTKSFTQVIPSPSNGLV